MTATNRLHLHIDLNTGGKSKETEKLLRQLGLSEWDVWRYRDYVGLTPKERLGYDSNEAVGLITTA